MRTPILHHFEMPGTAMLPTAKADDIRPGSGCTGNAGSRIFEDCASFDFNAKLFSRVKIQVGRGLAVGNILSSAEQMIAEMLPQTDMQKMRMNPVARA